MTEEAGVTGMNRTLDELAGVVDLFGALTRDELADALHELAFKRGEDVDADAVDAAIERAIDQYALVAVSREDADLIVPGPAAFPTVPDGGPDLPHILDVERRDVPRDELADALRARFAAELADDPGDERRDFLLDVTYDAETWADIDAAGLRERLADRREG
ncbi:hypothetical protein GCM10009019_15540 [Salarchaeum japonicum]|uniref:Uncharacterized protein n=2 Tax=Salarchaeum japonicum TaxID=555573 RepID=A0AAV3T0I4_9EURY